jgi:maltose O-acetyltransferase
MATEHDKMVAGEMYDAMDPELVAMRRACRATLRRLNVELTEAEADDDARLTATKKLLGSAGERVFLQPPFYCDYGWNIHVGEDFYCNFNCVVLDVCPVRIGRGVMFGPAVQVRGMSKDNGAVP